MESHLVFPSCLSEIRLILPATTPYALPLLPYNNTRNPPCLDLTSMAQFYLFSSTQKLSLFSKFLFRRPKRLLRSSPAPVLGPSHAAEHHLPCAFAAAAGSCNILGGRPTRDPNFYLRDSDGAFLVFLVEKTLFKVHRWLLLQEQSAFADMISLQNPSSEEGANDTSPIVLSDTAEQFRDLLWVLYTPPLTDPVARARVPFERLLNVVEMTNKYCFESYRIWAIDTLCLMVQSTTSSLRNASPELLARALHVAALCDHRVLLDLLTRYLISRLLWYNMRSDGILEVAERYRLAKIIGVIFYKQLVGLEQVSYDCRIPNVLLFPPGINVERRMQLVAAQHSLTQLWNRLKITPTSFHHDGCRNLDKCRETWAQLWMNAVNSRSLSCYGSADILGRLKAAMINLRKALPGPASMSMSCTLSALESISLARDDIIDGLIDHFVDF